MILLPIFFRNSPPFMKQDTVHVPKWHHFIEMNGFFIDFHLKIKFSATFNQFLKVIARSELKLV